MIAYLDCNVVLFLLHGKTKSITKRAQQALDRYELLLSPIVMLELDYLYECGRSIAPSEVVLERLYNSIDLRLCTLPFERVVRAAAKESWTRDAFDRLIVGHAKTNDEAPLITSDTHIAAHYPNVIW